MPNFLLSENAKVECPHPPGSATPLFTNRRVRVSGSSTIVIIAPYRIQDCPLNSPCTFGTWTNGARRVKSFGFPLVLTDSPSTSLANGSPMRVVSSQQRVKAT